jgi:hypothetical protein
MKRILNALALLVIVSNLTACSVLSFGGNKVKPVEVVTKAQERTRLDLKDPAPLDLDPKSVKWYVITKENAQQVFEELEKSGADPVLFGLTDKGYENLAISIAEIRNLIESQRVVIIKYKEYYEPPLSDGDKK